MFLAIRLKKYFDQYGSKDNHKITTLYLIIIKIIKYQCGNKERDIILINLLKILFV